ncbi:hypothetical protein JOF56_006281 [Kibdelosporangium banguiense]|uniref:Right handed beta helix domain-containing protein n=1 Tax=Kibdelosporangium banguiense TaxID=1365924 RepID=A0ABS4TNB2_9PSEU|nr:right-handed parallel beta-helix repeat-containing protein [Kibdelosporangium banguiense]MBP2325896.1 hypothetical protein [Kibdelosporangium banguiense]
MTSLVALTVLLVSSAPTIGQPGIASAPAACKNTTTDDETINNAIAASVPGAEIVITGTCLIDKPIRLLGDRTYRGENRTGTVIRQANGANLDAMLASDTYLDNATFTGGPFTIKSLTLIGNSAANPTARDVLVVRSWQTVVEDLVIEEAKRHALRVTSLSANGTKLTNTQVNGRISGNHIAASGGRGIFVEDPDPGNSVTDWQLNDNWIEKSGSDAIALDNSAGWVVRGNHVYEVGGAGIRASRMYGTTIADNYIEDFTGVGLQVTVQGDTASTISGNKIFQLLGSTAASTYLATSVNYDTANLAIVGNAIRGNGSGIGLDLQKGPGTALVATSTGNVVTGVTTPRRVGTGVTVSAGV